jgi:hypothetical protein
MHRVLTAMFLAVSLYPFATSYQNLGGTAVGKRLIRASALTAAALIVTGCVVFFGLVGYAVYSLWDQPPYLFIPSESN